MELRRIRHPTTTSTSDEAFRALEAGSARHGDVHLADAQTRGRGRLGRRWHSPAGAGVYASLVWSPGAAVAGAVLPAPAVTMASALGVRAGLAELLGARRLELKWPNDLLVGGAKLAGILVETRGLDARRPCWVIGVGVNVRAGALPAELAAERPVTSLSRLGCAVDSAEVAERVLPRLVERLERAPDDLDALAADFLAAWGLAGARVAVEVSGETLEGELAGLDLDRGLALRTAAGVRRAALELVRAVRPLDGDRAGGEGGGSPVDPLRPGT